MRNSAPNCVLTVSGVKRDRIGDIASRHISSLAHVSGSHSIDAQKSFWVLREAFYVEGARECPFHAAHADLYDAHFNLDQALARAYKVGSFKGRIVVLDKISFWLHENFMMNVTLQSSRVYGVA